MRFADEVDIGTRVIAADEGIVSAVCRPDAATFLGRSVPARQQRVQVLAIDLNLPQRIGVSLRVLQRKADT
jgi:hypothetical protein